MKKFLNDIKRANPNMGGNTKVIYGILIIMVVLMIIKNVVTNTEILIIIPVLIMSIVLHELAHGYVAYLNGDDTAKIQGRLTLNPIKHIDAFGLLLPIFLILTSSSFVIGWAKPVPVNYYKLNNQKSSIFYVSIAGIVTNLFLAVMGALCLRFLTAEVLANKYIYLGIIYLIRLNITLAIFNLLPIPPLDGSKIITAFGSNNLKMGLYRIERYGFIIIMLLLWTGVLDIVMNPLYKLFYSIINLIIGA